MSLALDHIDHAQSLAQRLDAQLRHAHPLEIIRTAYAEYGDELALVSSFGAESAVLLHLAAQVNPAIPARTCGRPTPTPAATSAR